MLLVARYARSAAKIEINLLLISHKAAEGFTLIYKFVT